MIKILSAVAVASFIAAIMLTGCGEITNASQYEYKQETKTEIIAEVGECVGSGYSGWSGSNPGTAMVKMESGEFMHVRCPIMVGMPIKFKRTVKYFNGVVDREFDWERAY